MAKFGPESEKALIGLHPEFVAFLREVVEHFDFSVLNGLRTLEQEKDYFNGTNFTGVNPSKEKLSKTMNSKHLAQADGFGHAVDAAPYPQDWSNPKFVQRLIYFAGFAMGFAKAKGFPLRSGADFNENNDPTDDGFHDLDHLEMKL